MSGFVSRGSVRVGCPSTLFGISVTGGTNVEDDSGVDGRNVESVDACGLEGSIGFNRRVPSTCIIGAKRLLCVMA